MLASVILSAAAVFGLVSAAKFEVQIGPNLAYSPKSLNAAVGDTVVFNLLKTNHDAVQADFANPCQPAATGFWTGFPTVSGQTFTITINDTKPIYFYCSKSGHCQNGMVGVINGPTTGDTLDAFGKAAAGTKSSSAPSSIRGGVPGTTTPA